MAAPTPSALNDSTDRHRYGQRLKMAGRSRGVSPTHQRNTSKSNLASTLGHTLRARGENSTQADTPTREPLEFTGREEFHGRPALAYRQRWFPFSGGWLLRRFVRESAVQCCAEEAEPIVEYYSGWESNVRSPYARLGPNLFRFPRSSNRRACLPSGVAASFVARP